MGDVGCWMSDAGFVGHLGPRAFGAMVLANKVEVGIFEEAVEENEMLSAVLWSTNSGSKSYSNPSKRQRTGALQDAVATSFPARRSPSGLGLR